MTVSLIRQAAHAALLHAHALALDAVHSVAAEAAGLTDAIRFLDEGIEAAAAVQARVDALLLPACAEPAAPSAREKLESWEKVRDMLARCA
eukprot:gene10212-4642_t